MHGTKLLLHGLAALALVATSTPALAAKRVVVDKSSQTLRAYENGQLVFSSRVSTGKRGKDTPNGNFSARSKQRMHYSSLYDNAPMPYSVQFNGNYFIHGYSHVPDYPASRGCVRLPVGAASAFFNWVTPGTPITVTGKWNGSSRPSMRPSKRQKRRVAARRAHRHEARPTPVAERSTTHFRY